MIISSAILYLFSILYAFIIVFNIIGWLKLPTEQMDRNKKYTTHISLIIAMKNEEKNVSKLLEWIKKQSYPNDLYEVLLIDDYSDDRSFAIARSELDNCSNIKVLKNKYQGGKKNALTYGISESSGELIVVTDADCRAGKDWLKSIACFYQNEKARFISGPVRMLGNDSLFDRFQELEFSSLIISGAGSIGWHRPGMCNGANMAFTKEAFEAVGGYENDQFVSGDDMFLMWKIAAKYGKKQVRFLKNKTAIVDTYTNETIKKFYNQRIRWVSKSKGYKDVFTIITALTVFLTSTILLFTFPFLFFYEELLSAYLTLLLVKYSVDFVILTLISDFINRKKNMYFYPIVQIITIIYTVLIGFLGQFVNFKWKEKVNKNSHLI